MSAQTLGRRELLTRGSSAPRARAFPKSTLKTPALRPGFFSSRDKKPDRD
jgi:hypothetical protein